MIELVVGGARSGKSRYAQQAAEGLSGNHIFLATAQALDDEMRKRIDHHQRDRGDRWTLIEEPMQLSNCLAKFGRGDVVLVDCLTLWVTNWLCSEKPGQWQQEKSSCIKHLVESAATIFLVSNETGMGVIPTDKLSRDFVDECGWLHQELAQISDRVVLMNMGIPTFLKE